MSDHAAAARIASYLRAHIVARDLTARVGPFLIAFDQTSDNRYRNYALPEDAAEPTRQDVQCLINTFDERRRVPRLEYVPELAPAVLPALVDAGFKTEGLLPLMVCSDVYLPPQEPLVRVTISMISSDVDLESAARVQNEAYGEPDTSSSDIARLRSMVSRGGAVALARDSQTGEALGSGLYSAPIDGATEIAALGVRPGFRRQGIGGGLITALARHALARRIGFPFLMAAHDSESRLYRRLGFSDCGTMLHISR